jgi:outer membrane cobalamin receptor
VTIITRGEIERQQAVTVSEILTQVPGLHVDESGARGGLSSVYIRGGDPNFTAIMIDGIPINDPTNARGGSVDLSSARGCFQAGELEHRGNSRDGGQYKDSAL